jgi:hypothetical protein
MACGSLEIKRAALTAGYAFKLEGFKEYRIASLFPQKAEPHSAPGGRPPVPNQVLGFLSSSGKERGEVFCFQRLAQVFAGADSKKLKMRRLPPTKNYSESS